MDWWVSNTPGQLRDGLLLVQHLVLCPEEVFAVIVHRLELEVEAVDHVLQIRNNDRVGEKKKKF